ncbi:ion transporter [Aliikangiella coralliicola]|uniref:Ion transporter n=1 Tax=Aliikangiella coralliicola TaxID=2592383 RepID=A0A545U0C4_9GAMM|nr:ion transporter [Aliikangiella coralliicola]TQV82915.1 ion transporter [Aliikangiella coralliicola]
MGKKLKKYSQGEPLAPWREKIHEVIFEADTPAGKTFDAVLIAAITLSVIAVMLDSVETIKYEYGHILDILEWGFTFLFLVEYILRLISVRKPLLYATSFLGVVDLLSILPSFVSLFYTGAETLLVIRVLRVLRVFRVFKLAEYLGEADYLMRALRSSRRKIAVFLYTVFIFVVIFGSIMYLVEGEDSGFTSIPKAVYWAIITLTTVGYGDIVPQTHLGQMIASTVMIMGYAIIAVPTGIYSTELAKVYKQSITNNACINCGEEGHDEDAIFCKFCGEKL